MSPGQGVYKGALKLYSLLAIGRKVADLCHITLQKVYAFAVKKKTEKVFM